MIDKMMTIDKMIFMMMMMMIDKMMTIDKMIFMMMMIDD